MSTLPDPLEDVLGSPVATSEPLSGGDLGELSLITLRDGRQLVAKRGPVVDAEARMLSAMALLNAPVPRLLHAEKGLICLEYLKPAEPGTRAWRDLGQALSQMHSWAGQDYGWREDYAFGTVRLDNTPGSDWPAFWSERRLLPLAEDLPAPIRARVEALAADLPNRLPADPKPALLHGDLWTGNVIFTEAQGYLIDPACYYGDAEVDLAMLSLFGTPDPTFWRGYGRLSAGSDERRPIYQLFPALVHLQLFGDSYQGLVTRLLDEAGA
ncbi:fructosamine kinase family protein [Litorisediminicola beolgyonensis]|uniref:Fructosamine kinase family protein n=1 Tax=Litorisediminicola beolgyonensis TaxID=1173614 RepID=A0ABW3ZE07_9RHOB